MEKDDRSYFRSRAETELEAAEQARHPEAARAHFLLAGLYLDLADSNSVETPRLVEQHPMQVGRQ